MAKKIHWQIPFASAIDKKQYRVDIYQEGYTGSPVTLLAGGSPFNTEEDNNPDLFTPIRTQSGTLQVCTDIPGGGLLKAQDILPANNTDCPVQLVELNDGEEEVVWQGFLSCEAYSQDYIGIAQELSLSLISVLEAMDSVECDPTRLQGVVPVHQLIGYCFDEMERSTDFSLFRRIYIGEQGKAIASRYINTSLFFDVQEQNDEDYSEAILKGISLKEVLTKLATFMGWCVREDAERIFIQTAGADEGWISGTVAAMIEDPWTPTKSYVTNALKDMSDLEWRGTGHRISSRQGARNVEVVANMTPFDIQVGIPDGFPQGEYITAANKVTIPTDEEGVTAEATVYISKENDLNNRYELRVFDIEDYDKYPWFDMVRTDNVQRLYEHSDYDSMGVTINSVAGTACIAIQNKEHDFDRTGIYVRGCDLKAIIDDVIESDAIMVLRSIDHLNAYNGKFLLSFDAMTTQAVAIGNNWSIAVAVKWGDLFLQSDKKTWSSTFGYITLYKTDDPTEIPISDYNYGEVQVLLMPFVLHAASTTASYQQYILTSLSLEYQAPEDVFEDRSANHYFEALKTAFRDEVSVECDFGSSLDNLPNPSLILNVDPVRYYEPLTRMSFYDGMLTEERPEKHLLSRLATYYRKPHTSLELVAAFPGVLPIMRYRGLNDGKFYLPMAASRDWQQDTATLSMLQCEPYWRVYTEDGQIWTKDWDYIQLNGAGAGKVIYISSDTDLRWADRDQHLQDVYINGDSGGGTITAGIKKAVGIYFDQDQDPNQDHDQEGWLDFYRGTTLVFSIYVKAISN